MQCDTMRDLIANKRIDQATASEVVACCVHWSHCKGCENWLKEIGTDENYSISQKRIKKVLEMITTQLLIDPELRQMASKITL
jgi:hypothetical protein